MFRIVIQRACTVLAAYAQIPFLDNSVSFSPVYSVSVNILSCSVLIRRYHPRGGVLKKIQNSASFISPFSQINSHSSSSWRRRKLHRRAADLLPPRRGGLVDAGGAPVDVEVKVRRRQRSLDLVWIFAGTASIGADSSAWSRFEACGG